MHKARLRGSTRACPRYPTIRPRANLAWQSCASTGYP
jgi:hypothetical protein